MSIVTTWALHVREWIMKAGKWKMWDLHPDLSDHRVLIGSRCHTASFQCEGTVCFLCLGLEMGKEWKSSKEGEDEAEALVNHEALVLFWFPWTYSSVTLDLKKHNWCPRNVKYYISADMYRTIKMLNIPKQMWTCTKVSSRGTSPRFEKSYSCCQPSWFFQSINSIPLKSVSLRGENTAIINPCTFMEYFMYSLFLTSALWEGWGWGCYPHCKGKDIRSRLPDGESPGESRIPIRSPLA